MELVVLIGIFLVLTYAHMYKGSALERMINKRIRERARINAARKRGE